MLARSKCHILYMKGRQNNTVFSLRSFLKLSYLGTCTSWLRYILCHNNFCCTYCFRQWSSNTLLIYKGLHTKSDLRQINAFEICSMINVSCQSWASKSIKTVPFFVWTLYLTRSVNLLLLQYVEKEWFFLYIWIAKITQYQDRRHEMIQVQSDHFWDLYQSRKAIWFNWKLTKMISSLKTYLYCVLCTCIYIQKTKLVLLVHLRWSEQWLKSKNGPAACKNILYFKLIMTFYHKLQYMYDKCYTLQSIWFFDWYISWRDWLSSNIHWR